jgi:type I restriction enzyme S subunit
VSDLLVQAFDRVAQAPGGVARLRELILSLAVRGKLVPQDPSDEPVSVLLRRIRSYRDEQVKQGNARRERPFTPQADADLPFELPAGWGWIRFDDLIEPAKPISYGVLVPGPDVDRGVPFVRIADLSLTDPPAKPEKSISTQVDAQYQRTRLEGGEILMGVVGSIGKLGVAPLTWAGANIARAICRIVPVSFVNKDFVLLLLQSAFMRASFAVDTRTLAQPTLNVSLIRSSATPLPPVAEQSRIVARVDELMRLCDALEAKGRLEAEQHTRLLGTLLGTLTDSATPEELAANWQRVAEHFDLLLDRPEAVDALEQTILQLAVRGLLVPQDPSDEPADTLLMQIREHKARLVNAGKVRVARPVDEIDVDELPFNLPQTWAWARFGDITINRDGERVPVSSSDREQRTKVYDYYGASGVIDKIDGYLFDKTLLLIGEDGANLLNRSTPIAFLAHGKYWVNNHAHVIDTIDVRLMLYLELFVNAISLEPYVTGTAQPKMNQAKLNSIVVALPPLAEQSRIVARVTDLRRLCADLRQRLAASQATQSRLAEALVESVASA